MKRLIAFTAVMTLVMARPETYREQEDFQFSRSSSDDGSKSGYYGAQRGNMGGNYERAHNMDNLAQHQMSGLVRQVNGELGDGAKTQTGSVFSSANSRGTYGSGNFDLSNLGGRNFQEGTSYDSSQLHSTSHSSSARNSAGYTNDNSQSYSGYQRLASDAQTQADNLQSLDNLQQHNYGSSRRSSGYQSQSGFEEQRQYNSGSNSNSDYGSTQYTTIPVRIIVRPGGRVAVPVASSQVYDTTHGSSVINHNSLNSELESTSDIHQGSVSRPTNSKFYESSYRYNKKWEKHDTIPTSVSVVVPTESPIPKNSELYEDIDVHGQNNARGTAYQNALSSSKSGTYNAAHESSQSGYQSNYNSQYRGDSSNSNVHAGNGAHGVSSGSSNAYTQAQHDRESRYYGTSAGSSLNSNARHSSDSQLNVNSQVEDLTTRPKSYQSSYSYHKSWERQGDPYVIQPASNGYYDNQASQRLSSSTKNAGYTASYQPGNCDINCHIRVARSYGTDNQDIEQQSQSLDNYQQSSQQQQGTWENLENLSQQSQSNFNQHTGGQQAQSQWNNLEDFGQQLQGNFEQNTGGQQAQSQWNNLEDFGQQSQGNSDQQNVGQVAQSPWDKLEDLGQQSQSNWDQQNVGQEAQSPWDKLEDLNQQSQSNWNQQNVGQQNEHQGSGFENLAQEVQSNGDQQNVGQQSQSNWDNLEHLGQKSQSTLDQQSQSPWDKLDNLSQQSQSNWDQQNNEQQSENQGSKFENGQQVQDTVEQNVGQQSQNQWDKLEDLNQQSQSNWDQINVGQQSNNNWDKIEQLGQQSLRNWEKSEDLGQQSVNQNTWDKLNSKKLDDLHIHGQEAQNNQDIIHKLEKNAPGNKYEPAYEQTQRHKENNIELQTFINEREDVDHQQHSKYEENFNNIAIMSTRKTEPNDNTDFNYSGGFVNPFFNQNHKNQLANSENTYATNSENFAGSIWNSNIHSNSNSEARWKAANNSQTNIQQSSLTNLWAKLDKFHQFPGLPVNVNHTKIHLKTNKTDNFLNENKTISENQVWYKLANTSETNITSVGEGYQKEVVHPATPMIYKQPVEETSIAKDLPSIQSDKPETLRDVGRGDIGPDDIIDVNHSPISTLLIPHENKKTPLENDFSGELSVISLEKQKEVRNIVNSHINETFFNVSSNNEKHVKYNNTHSHNIQHNLTIKRNESSIGRQDSGLALQNNKNFEQEGVNIAQESFYKYGQENIQIFTQQFDNQQQDFRNLDTTLRNFSLEEQNLQSFGSFQDLDVGQVNKNLEKQSFDVGNVPLQGNLNQHEGGSFTQENVQDIKNEHNLHHNLELKQNKNNQSFNQIHPLQSFDKDLNIDLKETNLSRVQKSVRISNLDKGEGQLHDHEQSNPTEYYYAADYEQGVHSNEHDFDHDFNMQYQVYKSYSHDSEHQSDKKLSQLDTRIDSNDSVTFTTTTTSSFTSEKATNQHNVTPKPGFWKSVGNKFVSAKDTVVSWFKSMG